MNSFARRRESCSGNQLIGSCEKRTWSAPSNEIAVMPAHASETATA